MSSLVDKEGDSLKLGNLYVDESLEGTREGFTNVCFIESYKKSTTPEESEVVVRYESGLFRKISLAEAQDFTKNLRLIGRDNGRINFDDVSSYAISDLAQRTLKSQGYNEANLSAQPLIKEHDERISDELIHKKT